jgi:hypothetical protein
MKTPQILMDDDFRHGLDLTDRWAITRFPPRFSADDGIVSASDRGLYVKAAGTNSRTGEPAFSETATGEDDHVKWMVDTQHRSGSYSVPGFDAVPGQELQIGMWLRGRTFGTAAHPFGSAVTDPDTDLRLASFAMNTIDVETGMVFDVWMTNNAVYPYYERLNLTGTAAYAVFSSGVPAGLADARRAGESSRGLQPSRRYHALAHQRHRGRSRQQDRPSSTGRDDDHRSWRNSGNGLAAATELWDGDVHAARRQAGALGNRAGIPRAAV